MSDSTSYNERACDKVQELIAWYPGKALNAGERACVEEHVTGCPACADLLRFVTGFKEQLVERYTPHPDADALVRFVEDKASMDPRQRSFIEEHLAACADCREQAVMLEAVDRNIAEEEMPEPSASQIPVQRAGPSSRVRGFWGSLRRGLLGPVPAAVYLVLAVLAIGLLIGQPGSRMGRIADHETGDIGIIPRTGSVPGTLGGITILPDETERVRQAGRDETRATRIDAGKAQFLLLELTGLDAPPAEEERYTVELLREGAGEPAFKAEVSGKTFSDNYALCLSLAAGALAPGRYVVRMIGPTGDTIYRSSIDAR